MPRSPPKRTTKAKAEPDSAPAPPTPAKQVKADPDREHRTPTPTAETTSTPLSASAKKKLVDLEKQWGQTPYPKLHRPTPDECQEVYDLLCSVHGVPQRPKVLEDRPNAPAGCGQVPDVLDAVVRTILSQNTTSKNSTAAKNAIDEAFGRADYRAVLEAGEDKLAETIQCGGLAKVKSKAIVKILQRLDERQGGKGKLSLDYLHEMSDYKAMEELCSFDLVGVKTAACVLLFCLGRDCFAVDTHVHRITMSLGWIPPSATRDTAFFHLDTRIPNELKYGLHTQLVRHGRGCVKCSANGVTSMNHVESCPIRQLVNKKGRGGGGKKVKQDVDAADDENTKKELKQEVEDVVKADGVVPSPAKKRAARGTRSSPRGKRVKKEKEAEEDEKEEVKQVGKKNRGWGGSVAMDEAAMSGIMHGIENA